MPYLNIEDRRAAVRRHYQKNKAPYKARARAHDRRESERVRNYIAAFLAENPCADCGESDLIVLEFDHRDSSAKDFAIGNANSLNMSLNRVKIEIEKCDVRCANCHRRKTHQQRLAGAFDRPRTQNRRKSLCARISPRK